MLRTALLLPSALPLNGKVSVPGGPCGPVGPAGPSGPVAPVAPVAPFAPAGPTGPTGPCGPTAPAAPVAPVGPAGPAGPIAPVAPVAPVGPAGPIAPVAPVAPVGPAGPAGPIAPVAPVVPVRPIGPCGPAGPVGPAAPCGPTAPLVTSKMPVPTCSRKDPAVSPAGKSATIVLLLDETKVSMAPSIFTTGEPVAGNRSAPVMVMVAGSTVEFMMALSTVGLVAASCAWAAMADTSMTQTPTQRAGRKNTQLFFICIFLSN